MSYDLEVFTVKAPPATEDLLAGKQLQFQTNQRVLAGKNWQVVIEDPKPVDPEDLPVDVVPLIPGLQYLTEIHVEPIGAPKTAYDFASRVSKLLAKKCHGVVSDSQAETVRTPGGVKRITPKPRGSEYGVLAIGWWFRDVDSFHQLGFSQIVRYLEAELPEALPRRYGRYEPPKHKLAEQGIESFIEYCCARKFDVVWYPSTPFEHIITSIPQPDPTKYYGGRFRTGCLKFYISARVLELPGWDVQLLRAFLKISSFLKPFYGEIRTGGLAPRSWFWSGMPPVLGSCTLLGDPYLNLWQEFADLATETDGGLAYIDTFTSSATVKREQLPSVPDEIKMQDQKLPGKWYVTLDPVSGAYVTSHYGELQNRAPRVWPFEVPMDEP